MPSRWWLAPIGMGLIFAVVAVGCRGSGKEAGGEEDQALLEQVVLTADDLPAGLQRVSATFSTNEQAAEGAPDPEEELSKLESWGRRLGYEVTFLRGAETPPDFPVRGLQIVASLYDTAQGASFSLADDVSVAQSADWPQSYPQLTDVEVEEVGASGIGDQRYWIRVTGFDSLNPTALRVDDQVTFRVGRVRAFLRVDAEFPGATDRTVYSDQVEGWARLLSERIAGVLAAGSGT